MSIIERKLFDVNLQLFNDGGAVGTEGTNTSVAEAEDTPKAEIKLSGSSRRKAKSGEFENVVFGKQESSANDTTSLDTEGNPEGAGKTDVTTTSNTLEERRKAFDDLINGEYKDIYQERFQQVFDRRFKQVKGMESELNSQKPIIDMLMSKYQVKDVSKLEQAINEDTEFWESLAEEKGMTVEQFKAVQKLERENEALRAMQEQQRGQQQFQQQLAEWNQQAQRVKELYPSFNFQQEVQNRAFLDLLRNGISVEHAYKLIHFDEINQNAARVAAQTADAQAQARIKSKASRPSENGTSSQSAAIVRNDVSSLTKAERAEIARRVQRGDTISF